MPKENTKCTGTNCCNDPGGSPMGNYGTYFRWTGGVKTDKGGVFDTQLPNYTVLENPAPSDRCGGSNKGGAKCYNDCCFTQMMYCDHNGPNDPDTVGYQLCMHQRGCSKFVFPRKPMSGSDCTSADGCGPALTTINAGKAREIKCKNGPTSQCASLCPDDSQEDITNALNYKNKCAAMDGTSHCDKYDDPADPQKACGASPASTF